LLGRRLQGVVARRFDGHVTAPGRILALGDATGAGTIEEVAARSHPARRPPVRTDAQEPSIAVVTGEGRSRGKKGEKQRSSESKSACVSFHGILSLVQRILNF